MIAVAADGRGRTPSRLSAPRTSRIANYTPAVRAAGTSSSSRDSSPPTSAPAGSPAEARVDPNYPVLRLGDRAPDRVHAREPEGAARGRRQRPRARREGPGLPQGPRATSTDSTSVWKDILPDPAAADDAPDRRPPDRGRAGRDRPDRGRRRTVDRSRSSRPTTAPQPEGELHARPSRPEGLSSLRASSPATSRRGFRRRLGSTRTSRFYGSEIEPADRSTCVKNMEAVLEAARAARSSSVVEGADVPDRPRRFPRLRQDLEAPLRRLHHRGRRSSSPATGCWSPAPWWRST